MRTATEFVLRRLSARSAALVLAGLVLAVPAVVLANHQFPDVPTGHTFHSQIEAIAEAGITAGFGDGGYHPSDPVTRQAMAAFMQRGFGRVGLAVAAAPITASVSTNDLVAVPVRRITITVPGATNAFSPQQLVYLRGTVTFAAAMNSANNCPCAFYAVIRDLTTGVPSPSQIQTFESSSSSPFPRSFDVEAVFPATPGTRDFQLEVGLHARETTIGGEKIYALDSRSSLSAMTFPFGPAGTNDL
jgi:hypothetical protein